MSQMNKTKKTSIISTIIFCTVIIVLGVIFLLNRQRIIDQISVWQYNPSTEIVSLAERAGMSDNGKFIFYASQPKLESTNEFNKVCNKIENTNSILGCFYSLHIYIYNVTDPKLEGVREVTASHETLHAIYVRLSNDERTKINKLIEVEYEKLQSDKEFIELMAFYERTEPGERDNELHSLIGTEVSSISPELEDYYSKYFSDRQKVVALNTKYIGAFNDLKKRDDEITSKIDAAYASITDEQNAYSSAVNKLDADITAFNNRASRGDFTSQSQFNYERSLLVARSTSMDDTREKINSEIVLYEAMIEEHNLIASESEKLFNLIDSTLAPAPSI